MNAIGSLIMVNIDSPDPAAQAEFYHHVLGWEVTHSSAEYAMISDGTSSVGFGKIDAYRPPAWPDEEGRKRFHLDFSVDDLDKAEEQCVALGARRPEFQPGETWRVLLDPAGHPFCVCQRS